MVCGKGSRIWGENPEPFKPKGVGSRLQREDWHGPMKFTVRVLGELDNTLSLDVECGAGGGTDDKPL